MHNPIVLFINIGGSEGVVIIFAALLLFGGKKLPELARGVGKGIREFKDATDDMKREIHRNINSIEDKPEVKETEKSGVQEKIN
jgi:sec-independent protein translocase protein TatA